MSRSGGGWRVYGASCAPTMKPIGGDSVERVAEVGKLTLDDARRDLVARERQHVDVLRRRDRVERREDRRRRRDRVAQPDGDERARLPRREQRVVDVAERVAGGRLELGMEREEGDELV